ncbi:ras association domain-containing protein 10-like [Sitophilus oryzae]|uniref:Ras association domain-containing protein 10-like n=1 Tax=Sitophilus oryzae TaxID=7048 RepID=A0A6J2YY62_SITOR|nr:ras association domain-containing protein 10-like [Sitophilus oryzae]XP_030767760.1 ras association domain-containing protein 10-like [Sitophilus oryzae]
MWLNDTSRSSRLRDDSDLESSGSSGEEIPVWIRGEQRWVSGITDETTCYDVIQVLLKDEEKRGRHMGSPDHYQITERWRGVEQSLEPYSKILDIWNTWGSAQTEVKISLRRLRSDRSSNRRTKCRSDASIHSDRSAWRTIHPKRFQSMHDKEPSSTEELLKLVLAQGEVIRRQLKKLRHSEHQIGYLEDKAHRARVRKHGSNYLLETYLKGLAEAVDPETDHIGVDKNSDSGVMTEGDSEQSHNTNPKECRNIETTSERFSPSSEEFNSNIKDDDTSSTVSESAVKEQLDLLDKIIKLNKHILKEEEQLTKLDSNLKKYDRNKLKELQKAKGNEEVSKELSKLRTDMAKSACEMQHNEVVLEETLEVIEKSRRHLETLHRELSNEDYEYEMLQALLYSNMQQGARQKIAHNSFYHTKELLDTLV